MLVVVSGHAEIYRWVDEKGQVHFGDKPGSADHEVIQQQDDSPAVTTQPEPDKTATDKTEIKEKQDSDNAQADFSKEQDPENAKLSEKEKARLKRIEDMDALSEELRIAREAREKKRDKEKEELRLLRKGCTKAQERVEVLQAQIDHYITSQKKYRSRTRPEEITLDTKRQRMAAELESRREYVKENCNNL